MPLRPLNDFLIVEPGEQEFTDSNPEIVRILNEGLIKVPEAFEGWFKKSPMNGEVVSCGNKCKYSWKTGDKVIYGRFAGAPITVQSKKYLLLREEDLIAREE